MKKDIMHQLAAAQQIVAKVKKKLEAEKAKLESRLEEINAALGEKVSRVVKAVKAKKRGRKRVKNAMSLREAVLKVTSAKPLNRKEILEELKKVGYKFDTSKPEGSLNTMLYTNKATFQIKDKKISSKKK